ncbi:MAG: hypothetical protein E4H13_15470 [Calditrichales bacterium]|nr:MAG: hypothetical protein E4H13_15470 [Calditrichales bacterium]
MLDLTPSEVRIVRVWSGRAEASPFPQEINVVRRLKSNPSDREMKFTLKELEVILHWADQATRGHYGTEQYVLENEGLLIDKIETYINNQASPY